MSKLNKILSGVLNIPEEKITDDTSPDNTESWDSFNSLMLVSELERNYSISFTIGEVTGIRSVADIKKCLKIHGVDEYNI